MFDNYNTKIEKTYYYAIHNTIESKITCLEGYQKSSRMEATISVLASFLLTQVGFADYDERSYSRMK